MYIMYMRNVNIENVNIENVNIENMSIESMNIENMNINEKYEILKNRILEMGKICVAYSSGVDSTFLLKVAHDLLGDNAVAVTAHSYHFPDREFLDTVDFCKKEGIRHIILETDQLQIEEFVANPPDRCYICKKSIFAGMKSRMEEEGIFHLLEGSNMDDLGDYRPGMKAIKELGIESPLKDAGLYKEEIRILSKELGLPTWDKPSYACLASRFPYGEQITAEKLKMVEQAEDYLMSLGFIQMRVRIHGNVARIEIPNDEMDTFFKENIRIDVNKKLKELGFSYVTVDLQGFRSGSMNETLVKNSTNVL